MKKTIRKVALVLGLGCMMSMSLTGCKKKTECAQCGETKTCTKYEFDQEGNGEKGEDWFCEDCVDACREYCERVGGYFKKK